MTVTGEVPGATSLRRGATLSPAVSSRRGRPFTVGLVSGGLGAYWPQFPELLPQLRAGAATVGARLAGFGAEVVDVGFVSDAAEASAAAEALRVAGCDLVVVYLATYLTATMVVPIAQRGGAPLLIVDLQPEPAMDHATFSTGDWLAYCGSCPLPEIANAFERCHIPFRSVSGHLRDERAWARIGQWVAAAAVHASLRYGRHGLLGHLYPGMYDVAADLTMVPAVFGGHVEVLEIDDLHVRAEAAGDPEVDDMVSRLTTGFDLDTSVDSTDLRWAARVAVGLERLVDAFDLDSLAYYYRGLAANAAERTAAGMIAGASLLTARGVPTCGEYELRTSLAMVILDRLGAGGSFTELQALNFRDGVVEMGHDGPGHLAISDSRPLLRGLGLYHGKRGFGVSVEFGVRHGPVTAFGVTQLSGGRWRFVVSEGEVVGGTLLQIGNTTSRVDFGRDPGEWCDSWAATAVAHHFALGVGHRRAELTCVADLLGIEMLNV